MLLVVMLVWQCRRPSCFLLVFVVGVFCWCGGAASTTAVPPSASLHPLLQEDYLPHANTHPPPIHHKSIHLILHPSCTQQHTMSGPLRPLGRSISLPGSVANRKFSATTLPPNAGLHHQGSGVSVSSTYDDDDGGHHGAHHHHGIPIKGGRKQERSFRGRVRHEAASRYA